VPDGESEDLAVIVGSTLAELLDTADRDHPAVVLPADGATTSFAELASQVEALSARLVGAGLRSGDAVVIAVPNGLEWLVTFLAVTRARLVAAPLNSA
jgi:acyl-CoA synthetase (AMP-forming)/AMP-acid ligase II